MQLIPNVLNRVSDLLDYTPEDLVGKSMYSLCHAEDAIRLKKHHMDRKQILKYFLYVTLLIFEKLFSYFHS